MRFNKARSKARPFGDRASWPLKAGAIFVLLFLHIPIVIIILYAFTTDDRTFRFPPPGLTTRWFETILTSRPDFWSALALSLQVAAVATAAALILGTLISAGMSRTKFFGREVISLIVVLPLALPGIVTGIALRSAMGFADIPFSFWTIIIGHATFCIVVIYNVIARLRRTAQSQTEASMDLGATSFQTFRHIMLPVIATAMLAGGLLAFALSFDEIIVTTFTAGQQQTLPIWIFSQLSRPRQRPVTNVAAVFVILLTSIPIMIAARLTRQVSEET
jgi:putative spermidine/putrescine transport system permease protein